MELANKNGLPWTGLYKFPIKVKDEILTEARVLHNSQNWGKNYEYYRRLPSMNAIYPHTRAVVMFEDDTKKNMEFLKIVNEIIDELQPYFNCKITYWVAELTLLMPFGFIPFHYDRKELCRLSNRIIIPLSEQSNIIYKFCSWKETTPENVANFSNMNFLSGDVNSAEMLAGNYYFFNHRVPHSTLSNSPTTRANLSIDLLPVDAYENYKYLVKYKKQPEHTGITAFEKTKILPPLV